MYLILQMEADVLVVVELQVLVDSREFERVGRWEVGGWRWERSGVWEAERRRRGESVSGPRAPRPPGDNCLRHPQLHN